MALWDNITKKASETTAKAIQQAKILSETTRLNGLISDEEGKIDTAYFQIGKLYTARYRENPQDEFAGLIAAIVEAEQKIAEYRIQIQDVKGVLRCANCGAEVAKGMAFCSACGTAMPKVEGAETSNQVKCEECGAMVEKGMRFCTACGKPMKAAAQPAEAPAKRVCAKCGTESAPDMAFCSECGNKL